MNYVLPVSEVKVGAKLVCDAGFLVNEDKNGKPCGCLQPGQVVKVHDRGDGLFVYCADGEHYLDGQLDETNENYVGFLFAEAH